MLKENIELILEDESRYGDTAVVKNIEDGKTLPALHKDFPGILFEEDNSNYFITTRNIEMMLKLYMKIDSKDKEILIATLRKILNARRNYYYNINYFAFTVILLIDKNIALESLKSELVIDREYAWTLTVLGIILIFKHDLFEPNEISSIKSFLIKVLEKLGPYGDPTVQIPFEANRDDELQIFNVKSHLYVRNFKNSIIPGILQTIHKIEHYRLGKFLQDINPEINKDKIALLKKMEELKFPKVALNCIEKVDSIYSGNPDEFDFKSCLGHLRSFFEEIFLELKNKIEKITGSKYMGLPKKFNDMNSYLKKVNFINEKELAFYQKFYDLVSTEGVHSFTSTREYVRICKNVIIEISLLLLDRYPIFEGNVKSEKVNG
ncbi:MAG: hypothetical protein JSW64_00400 [Candidatus Zixiibacteriota bacterium]|nr:MAG: hypothetical protein JSW64_00400 [candidate division Zixibacteria bacterium]